MGDFDLDDFDQIVKGRVGIKKLSKYRYRITFSKICKFLIYQVWNKNNPNNINDNRYIYNMPAKDWVNKFKAVNEDLQKNNKPLFTPTTIMETEDGDSFAFVIDKAYINCHGRVVFTVSTKEIQLGNNISKKMTQLPIGKCNNMRFDIDEVSYGSSSTDGKTEGYCHYTYGHPCTYQEVEEWRKTHYCPGGPKWVDRNCGTGCLSRQQTWWGGLVCANY
jgi:hypothetical protein